MGLVAAFRRLFPTRASGASTVELPEAIRQSLAGLAVSPILSEYIQTRLQADKGAPEFDQLMSEARRLGWPPFGLEKLEIFGAYYRNDYTLAYEKAFKYLDVDVFDPDLCLIAALCLYQNNHFDEAYEAISRARGREHYFAARADYFVALALIASASSHVAEARNAIDRARLLAPDNEVIAFNAYAMYLQAGDMEAFEHVRQQILDRGYSSPGAAFARAHCELALDHYEEGFRLLEQRYDMPEAHRYLNEALLDKRRWRGEDLAGRRLLLTTEQGLGDTVMMARYLPLLARRCPNLVVECQPEAISLLANSFPDIEILPLTLGAPPKMDFDVWLGSMSLPFIFGTTPSTVIGTGGYLTVPMESADYWQRRVAELSANDSLRIGLAWSGRPTHRTDRQRSIPFNNIADVIRGVEADFFALQTQIPNMRPANLVDVSAEIVTLADTAALMEQMDLIISVDTSVVHIAGAIGKEAWLLLPYRYEWRWSLEGERNHWYDSVRVLRQSDHGDWDGLLDNVFKRRLRERFST